MLSDFIINLFTPEGFVQAIAWGIVFLEFVYTAAAFIIMREVSLMNESLQTDAAFLFSLLAKVHFFLALGLLLFSILVVLA